MARTNQSLFMRRTKRKMGKLDQATADRELMAMAVDKPFLEKMKGAGYHLTVTTNNGDYWEGKTIKTALQYHIFVDKGRAKTWVKAHALIKEYGYEKEFLVYSQN